MNRLTNGSGRSRERDADAVTRAPAAAQRRRHRAGRGGRRRRGQADASGDVDVALGALRRPRRAQGREPPADRLVQDPRRPGQAGRRLATAARRRRGRGQRRQPRPGGRLRRPATPACRARSSCRPAPRSPRSRPARSLRRHGGLGGESLDEAVAAARARAAEAGMVVHATPSTTSAVVAGQGTLGRRARRRRRRPEPRPRAAGWRRAGLRPGHRGQARRPDGPVIGVQVAAARPTPARRRPTGRSSTLADGIAVKRPGPITAPARRAWLDDDRRPSTRTTIADAMVLLMERAKLYVEGGGAVGVAALLTGARGAGAAGTTCVVLSGGNVDLGVAARPDPPPRDPGRPPAHPLRPDQRPAGRPRRPAHHPERAGRQPRRGRARARGRRPPRPRDRRARRARGPRPRARRKRQRSPPPAPATTSPNRPADD